MKKKINIINKIESVLDFVDSVIYTFGDTEEKKLYRSENREFDLKINDIFSEHQIMPTTTLKGCSYNYGEVTTFSINAKKGTYKLLTDDDFIRIEEYTDDSEYLLPRTSKFLINNIYKNRNLHLSELYRTTYECEFIQDIPNNIMELDLSRLIAFYMYFKNSKENESYNWENWKDRIKEFKYKSRDFNSQEISNFIWSLATLDYSVKDEEDEECLKILCREFKYKCKDFNSQNLSNFIWALATLNFYDEETIQILIKSFYYKCKDFNSQDMQNFIWSIMIFDKNVDFVLENYTKLQKDSPVFTQVYLYLKYYKNIDIPEEKLEILDLDLKTSDLQKDVYKYLNKNFIEEYILYCYSIDIADPVNKIAVEVNGPSHYINNKLNLKDELKYNILKSLGWKVYVINYKIWDNLTDKETYIKNLIF